MIIGFTGKKKAGKDTASLILINKHNFISLAFADPLKKGAKELFDLSDEQLHDQTKKEIIDERWNMSPRQILQWLGTDILRNNISDEIFITNMKNKLKNNSHKYIIITDVRFDNEAEMIKNLGGIIININRNNIDESKDNHITESGINSKYIDINIDNNGTIDELHNKVLNIFDDLNK